METIDVEVPAAFKSAAQCFSRRCELAESAGQMAAAGDRFAYADLERAFALGAQAVQCDLHAVVMSAMAFEAPRLLIDGVMHRRAVQSITTFYSLAGPVPVTRWLYRPLEKRDAPTIDPVALRIGTVAGTWTPGTASAMAFIAQQGPVREAAQLARQLGVLPYSAASFHRVTLALGERYEAHQNTIEDTLIARHVVPAHATGIALSLDRTAGAFEVPRRRGRGRPRGRRKRPRKRKARGPIARVWKMIYCACWTLHDKDGRAIETVRYGCVPDDDAEYVAAALLTDVAALRVQRPDLLVEVICDGAPEMWNLLDGAVAEAGLTDSVLRLVDLWHLLGYVGKALRARYDETRASQELPRWKMRLLNQSTAAARLLQELASWGRALRTDVVGGAEAVADAIAYLTNQIAAGRVDYAAARRAGQPVGSGHVEATCISLVGVRFKRPGARWKPTSGGLLMLLRAVALSGRWAATMELLHTQGQHEIKKVA